MLLKAPGTGTSDAPPIAWLDALFLSVSAITSCGLTPIDPARHFSITGFQALGLLMELGLILTGLAATLLLMRRVYASDLPLGRIVRRYLLWSAFMQILATTAIVGLMSPDRFPAPYQNSSRIGWTLFHVVSSLGNSGLTMNNRLTDLRVDLLVHVMLLPLMVAGNLGLPVIWDILRSLRSGQPLHRLTKNLLTAWAAIYLVTTLLLLGSSLLPYAYRAAELDVEMNRPLATLTWPKLGRHLADASSMAIGVRSTGIVTQSMSEIRPMGQIVLMANMPLSLPGHAGGAIGFWLLGGLFGGLACHLPSWHRAALGRLLVSMAMLLIAMLVLTAIEPFPIQTLFFESLGALTGSGLSLGITAELGPWGKLMLMGLMLLGLLFPVAYLVRMADRQPS